MVEKHTGFGVKWKCERASNFKHSFLNSMLAWTEIIAMMLTNVPTSKSKLDWMHKA